MDLRAVVVPAGKVDRTVVLSRHHLHREYRVLGYRLKAVDPPQFPTLRAADRQILDVESWDAGSKAGVHGVADAEPQAGDGAVILHPGARLDFAQMAFPHGITVGERR